MPTRFLPYLRRRFGLAGSCSRHNRSPKDSTAAAVPAAAQRQSAAALPLNTTKWLQNAWQASSPSLAKLSDREAPGPALKLLRQLWHDLEQVADQADVGDLEDRRFLVF